MKTISYVAHPVGQEPERARNLRRVGRWLAWLVASYPDRAFNIPWLPYCLALNETPANRERGIGDDLVILGACNEIVLVGGVLSPGMAGELDEARRCDMPVLDLLHLGPEPPVIA